MLKNLCNIDGKHVMAFVETIKEKNQEQQIAVSHYALGDNENEGEIAVTVADDWQQQGIGTLLMKPLFEYARNNGIKHVYSLDLASNVAMAHLAKDLGMTAKREPDDAQLVRYSLEI
jgi:N-acetylglutamate synthase-like GNAT family acetyltransferase